jgi:hypothetical protein
MLGGRVGRAQNLELSLPINLDLQGSDPCELAGDVDKGFHFEYNRNEAVIWC